jgi:benzodiazapine receptor
MASGHHPRPCGDPRKPQTGPMDALTPVVPPLRQGPAGSLRVLLGLTLLCGVLGAFGGLLTRPEIAGWYATLVKPSFTPPNWVFGPVWTTLYVLLAYSAWRTWDATGPSASLTKATFWIVLGANTLWSPLFFSLHRPDLALIDILCYAVMLACWIRMLHGHDRVAAWLQLPHLLWVCYAGILNASLWWLN